MPWPLVYYRAADGSEPVNDYIDHRQIQRLVDFGPDLGFPYTSQIEGELRELRCHFGANHYRVLYRRSRHLLVLLHFLSKRTHLLPSDDIDLAKARWADFVLRMNEYPRRSPRAAGRDAP